MNLCLDQITADHASALAEAPDRWAEAEAIRAFAKAVRKPDYSRKSNQFQRFWPRVVFAQSGCWIWTGGVDELGYGRTGTSATLGEVKAHRFAYRLFKDEISGDLEIMHTCDVRCCVNPDHLILGTHAENIADMVGKGRHRSVPLHGERNPMARLTQSKVAEIRRLKRSGVKQIEIARRFGVSPMTISRAVRGESWR